MDIQTSFIAALPANTLNISLRNNILQWEVPKNYEDDDNESFVLEYDFDTKFANWEGQTIPSGGQYYRRIHNIRQFEKALEDWESNSYLWNE